MMKPGQIISHCCRFPPEEEEELDRHLILSMDGAYMETYLLFTHIQDCYCEALELDYGPGTINQILISSIDFEEETPNNFYWKIMS